MAQLAAGEAHLTAPPRESARRPFGMAAGQKRRFVQRLFGDIASRYDLFNRLASCGLDQSWRSKALELGRVGPGMQVLDVCTGTGDFALLAAKRVSPGGHVIGVDFTPAMLAEARRKSAAAAWIRGDALSLPFPPERFDRLTIGFSTRNLSDLDAGLREMARVLKAGGQLIILETGRPANPLVRWGYQTFLSTVVRLIGWALTGRVWPFTYLARSVEQFLPPEEVCLRLKRAGLEPAYVPLMAGLCSVYLAVKPGART